MKPLLYAVFFYLCLASTYAQTGNGSSGRPDIPKGSPLVGEDPENKLSPLLNYNFSGSQKGLSGLTPIIRYGWNKTLTPEKTIFELTVGIEPYVAGQISIKDSTNYVPALMLPGNAGFDINWSVGYDISKGIKILVNPLNFGYKLNSNFSDENKTINQHNIRHAAGVKFSDLAIFGFQYTTGWHNSVSSSEATYKDLFKKDKTKIHYILLSLQTKLGNIGTKAPTYLMIEWRKLLGKSDLDGLSNHKILTIGLRANLDFKDIAPTATAEREDN